MDVPVELSQIVIVDTSPQQVIVLKEIGGERSFPIVIGVYEALAIDRRCKGVRTPRPLTHDLLGGMLEAMGGRLERIVISDLQDHTFYAKLVISRGDQVIEVDSRPSDAIALGVGLGTPIFVADHVLSAVLNDVGDLSSQRESLKHRQEQLVQQISIVRHRIEEDQFTPAEVDARRALKEQYLEMQTELDAIEEILRQLP